MIPTSSAAYLVPIIAILLLTGMVLSVRFRKLTLPAALAGGAVGWIIFAGAGIFAFIELTTFFLLGTLATSWKRKEKHSIDGEGLVGERRKTGQVLANAGAAAILALIAGFSGPGHKHFLQLMIAGSFASATADTLSSELGTVYGRRFYHSLTWKRDTRGLDGVISLEGTLIGLAGAGIIAGIYIAGIEQASVQVSYLLTEMFTDTLIIILAGGFGNFMDSVLGATLERKGILNNDWVNFCSTALAALFTAALAALYTTLPAG